MIYPPPLTQGDTIAFISPAGRVDRRLVLEAARHIEAIGFKVRIMPHAFGPANGSYSAIAEERLQDFIEAWTDPDVGAVICSRGGYGCVHLLDKISDSLLLSSPKWLVGFSDVSALHARLFKAGIASVHGSMARYIAREEGTLSALLDILCASKPQMQYSYTFNCPPRLNSVTVRGTLVGGNLAVLSHLICTPFDPFTGPNNIIFIEDISEAIYATERMLWQLHLSGVLARAKALVIGQFTDSQPDENYPDTRTMIAHRLQEWGYAARVPVLYGLSIGHIPDNIPLIHGADVEISIDNNQVTLKSFNNMTFSENANQVFDRAVAKYHETDSIDTPAPAFYPSDSLEAVLFNKCWVDAAQWHMEDLIRVPDLNPAEGMALKRRIDRSNQVRTDMVEDIDSWFRNKYESVTPMPDATINTESPAWAIDRLSILALKIWHMREQAERTDADEEHRATARGKLDVLLEQRADLSQAIDALLADIAAGRKYMKVYRQMKLYNDPATNPELYKKR